VAFSSDANNLVEGDTNDPVGDDIFVKDLNTGSIVRISTDSDGGQTQGITSSYGFSSDGLMALFNSTSSHLVTESDTNQTYDLFIKKYELDHVGGRVLATR
jgi:hypothetical protein